MLILINIMTTDQNFLNNYFRYNWKPSTDAYQWSSYEVIASKIKNNEWLLDVGCGHNPFKKLVSNVIGIDPACDEADYKITIEEFIPDRLFDVATCLGSINFGDKQKIETQIKKVVSCLKEDAIIYWRCNPGRKDHVHQDCEQIDFFPWSFDYHRLYSKKFGFSCVNEHIESNGRVERLYCEWRRLAFTE